ncbi:phosphopentomutase [uncultured Photobacterium sp.]|uniref:phosphopentomutase n=1 Tax=uncultured Photobacterium sp. TaxID=173973 RepID=UPI002633D47A|nr:phosphopentomutase [uncultured Photobacterium sp.]
MAKFIVVVLDGFGIGEMPDVATVRPQDLGANTAGKLLNHFPLKRLPTLEKLGLINIVGATNSVMNLAPDANWGKSKLAHYGCDTFMGHQEIMGTHPKPPMIKPFQQSIDDIEEALNLAGYQVERISRKQLQLLMVNGSVVIGDNLEADLGQVYNLTANFGQISFDDVKKIGQVVRSANAVSRNIAFGGFVPTIQNILNAIETKTDKSGKELYIGVNAPDSGTYDNGFQVVHLGYGVNAKTQVPYQLNQAGIHTYLYGKVADIVQNDTGTSFTSVVDTDRVFELLINDLHQYDKGFFCANVQETDLSGHQQDPKRYWTILEKADRGLASVIAEMEQGDMLVVMADHGNDPFIGHTKHTREQVPLMVYSPGVKGVQLDTCETMADIGASVAAYFGAPFPEFGCPVIATKIKRATPTLSEAF